MPGPHPIAMLFASAVAAVGRSPQSGNGSKLSIWEVIAVDDAISPIARWTHAEELRSDADAVFCVVRRSLPYV